ncbi:LamG-like jellyroll fold domain-containing protein [Kutzneria chonburiensis]|uniref:LamG-like jellyroll fold domain-containing protein n=1 Tax=Kutzneria chonburiensis TaxID=1483604 RepID=A0ABV6MT71_9PSEU|nr:LamG-like jellyroll fold domain-containing protein [Kutzneria chonburiensis]
MRARIALLTTTMAVAAMVARVTASAATVLGTVPVQAGQRLSVSIYDEAGNVVRQLADLSERTGQRPVSWDGKDDNGDDMPPGRYSWRAAVSTVTGAYDNQVGDPGKQVGNKPFAATETPSLTAGVAYDPAGNLFTESQSEEFDPLRKYPPGTVADGQRSWYMPGGTGHRGYAVAADNDHIYVAARLDGANANQLVIYRTDAHTGANAPFSAGTPYIVVNGQWTYGRPVVSCMAVDQRYLLVSDNNTNNLLAYDKTTGAPAPVLNGQSSLHLSAAPHAIATDGAGTYWIAVGTTVQQYTLDSAGHFTAGQTISGLNQPYGVAWDHTHSLLYVSDAGTGKIRVFDVSAAPRDTKPAQFDHLGLMNGPGPVDDDHFGWQLDTLSAMRHGASIAVSPDGTTLVVTDIWNQRTLFFDTTTGKARPERFGGVFNPAPDVDNGVLNSKGLQFAVRYDLPGHPWQLAANWTPDDNADAAYIANGSVIRTIDGRQYLYEIDMGGSQTPEFPHGGVIVYRLGDNGGRGATRVAQLRVIATGTPLSGAPDGDFLRLTTDRDGIKAGDPETHTNTSGFVMGNPSLWVDGNGDLWFAEAGQYHTGQPATVGIGTLKMHHTGTALYDLADFAVPQAGQHEFDPSTGAGSPLGQQVRHNAGSDLVYSEADTGSFNQFGGYMGNTVSVVSLSTGKRFLIPGRSPLDGTPVATRDTIDAIALDSTGGYLYTTNFTHRGQEVDMRTWDGLPVGHAAATPPRENTGEIDMGLSMAAFTNTDGRHYVYAEDDGDETNQRFVFSNGTVRRYGSDPGTGSTAGDFTWNGVSTTQDLVAWWKLDAQRQHFRYIADSTPGDHWGIRVGLNPKTPAELPSGPRNGALSFDGTQYIVFTKNTNGATADNLFTSQTGDSVSLWFRTSTAGVILGTQNDGMVNTDPARPASHPPTAAAPLLYVDNTDKGWLHSGGNSTVCPEMVAPVNVRDGNWHHVAMTRTLGDDSFLYLDGKLWGNNACAPLGQSFAVLGTGFTTDHSNHDFVWPGTTGGYMPFIGALDDVRVYHRALAAPDVQTLAAPKPPSPAFADWKFDEAAGSTTFRDSAAEHDLTTAHSARPADGTGLHFTGDANGTAPVIAKRSVTVVAPETVAVRVRVPVGGAGGPVLGEQYGAYPESVPYPYIANSPASVAAISVVGGKVRSYVMDNPLNSDCSIADGQWHTIVVTSTADAAGTTFHNDLYVSGCATVAHHDTNQGVLTGIHTDMQFGAARVDPTVGDALSTWQYFAGDIGEAQVYQRVLSASELAALLT